MWPKTRFVFGVGSINKARVSSTIPSPPRHVSPSGYNERQREGSSHGRTKKGYVPVVVGTGDAVDGERFLIPAQFMGHPSIVVLLELSAYEFGYNQEGVLRIPCEPDCFREIINHLPFKAN